LRQALHSLSTHTCVPTKQFLMPLTSGSHTRQSRGSLPSQVPVATSSPGGGVLDAGRGAGALGLRIVPPSLGLGLSAPPQAPSKSASSSRCVRVMAIRSGGSTPALGCLRERAPPLGAPMVVS